MHTIRLKINDKVYDRLMWLLSKFGKDEVEVIPEDTDFYENQRYLKAEMKEIIEGKANFISIDEAEKKLDQVIKKHGNRI